MTLTELEESRPALDDGNYFIWLLRNGTLREAKEELDRLAGRSLARTRYGKPLRWLVWCNHAADFVVARESREPLKETVPSGE